MNSIKIYCINKNSTLHYFYIKKKFVPLLTKTYNEELYYVYCPICGAQNRIVNAKKIKWIKQNSD